MRRRLLALGIMVFGVGLASAQPPPPSAPFPQAQLSLIRRAVERLNTRPLLPLSGAPARPVAVRRLSLSGSPHDLLAGIYATPPGQPPVLVALQWGREIRRAGECPPGQQALDLLTFFLPKPTAPERWGGWHYRGCLTAAGQLAGPPTATPLALEDPATVALSRAILERLTGSGGP